MMCLKLDFKLFKNEPGFYSCFHISEDKRGFIYTDKMEFHVLEPTKLPKELKEDCKNAGWKLPKTL